MVTSEPLVLGVEVTGEEHSSSMGLMDAGLFPLDTHVPFAWRLLRRVRPWKTKSDGRLRNWIVLRDGDIDLVIVNVGSGLSVQIGGRLRSLRELRTLERPLSGDYRALVRIRQWRSEQVAGFASQLTAVAPGTSLTYDCGGPFRAHLRTEANSEPEGLRALRMRRRSSLELL